MRTKLAVQRTFLGTESPRYSGTFGTLRRVFQEEGMRGLFRGITPAVVSHAPAAAVFFSTYSFVRARVPDTLHRTNLHKDVVPSAIGAGTAWLTTCLLLNPLFVLKTKQQTQLVRANDTAPLKYTGLISSFRVIFREQGVRGLYVGVVASMAGAPGAMIQMPLYEYLKRGPFRTDVDAPPSNARVALASATASSAVNLLVYPIEVVRLRLQAQGDPFSKTSNYKGIADCCKKIFLNEGVQAFYRGLGTSLIRTVPQSAIGLSCYEIALRLTTKLTLLSES